MKVLSSVHPKFLMIVFYFRKNINPFRPNPGRREKIKLNFYFYTSLWYLKRPLENLLRHHKEVSEMHGTGRVKGSYPNFASSIKQTLANNPP